MSLLEGHGNAVMNRLGAELVDGQERMARVLQARRNARGATALLHRLLGLELKMSQYELGEAFVDAIEREAGFHAVDPAWRGPELLPTLDELTAPDDAGSPASTASPSRPGSAAARRAAAALDGVELDGLVAPVVVACSGGADSLGAAHRRGRRAGSTPVAVHVDHGLRPDSARGRRCRARRGAPARRARRAASRSTSSPAGTSKRARATRGTPRSSRRAASSGRPRCSSRTPPTTRPRRCCSTCCAGAGSSGLAGMPARRGHVVRPLLGVRRADVRALCVEHGLRAGRSTRRTHDRVHRRNWVRLEALPALLATARTAISCPVLNRQAAVLRAEADLLDELA